MRCAVEDLTIDAEAFELTRAGQPVAVEPKVLELLLFLIEHRRRVVSKDELVETVWRGQHVGDSALTRGIYEARRVLGDDAKRQVMIKTVYGRGYQFIGPYVELATPASGGSAPESGTAPTSPLSAALFRARRRIAAAVAVASLCGAAWWLGAGGGDVAMSGSGLPETGAPPGLRLVDRLAVLPIKTDGSDPQLQLAALSIVDQITVRFATQPGLTVRSQEMSRAAPPLGPSPDRLFEALQVGAALRGDLRRSSVAGRYQLSLDLIVAGVDRPVRVGVYEVEPPETEGALRDFLRVREAIAEDVLEHLSPSLASRAAEPISPTHPEALRLYLEARRRLATVTCGDASVVMDLIDRSLALDPGYAMPWAAKGFALYSEAWSCGRDASYAGRALEAAQEARRLAPSLGTALLLETFLLVEKGDAEQAYAEVRAFETARPASAASRYAAAYALRYAGLLDASKAALEQSLALDPLVLREFATAPVTLLYRGEVEAFLAHLPAAETPHDRFYRGLALVHIGEPEAAKTMLSPAYALNPTDLFARYAASLLASLDGDPASALEWVRGVVRQREDLGNRDGELSFKEAQLLALAGDGAAALGHLGRAVDEGFFCPRCLLD
ncbi:MAG: winged helix-turn-helix domain-containing protein, partial [Acidobacteriota bacterium]